jgi:hypothetical protein
VSIIQLFVSGVEIKDKQTIREQLLAGVGGAAAPKKGVAAIVGSSLYQMKLPESESMRTYGELFKSLTAQGIVPLGLYRGVFKNMQVGPKQNKLPYVFTNPPKETELFSCDRVFVLSQKPIMGKRTLTKRTDWSLVRNLDTDPVDQLRRQLRSVEDQTKRRVERLDTKLEDVLAALREVAGKDKFEFELDKEAAGIESYRKAYAEGNGGGGSPSGRASPSRSSGILAPLDGLASP